MTKPKYDLEDLAIFATYDGVDAHTNFVAEVAGSALDVIRGHERKVEQLRELEAARGHVYFVFGSLHDDWHWLPQVYASKADAELAARRHEQRSGDGLRYHVHELPVVRGRDDSYQDYDDLLAAILAVHDYIKALRAEVERLTAERDGYQAASEHAAQGLRALLDANADREHEGISRDDWDHVACAREMRWDAAILKAEDALNTANAALEDPSAR